MIVTSHPLYWIAGAGLVKARVFFNLLEILEFSLDYGIESKLKATFTAPGSDDLIKY